MLGFPQKSRFFFWKKTPNFFRGGFPGYRVPAFKHPPPNGPVFFFNENSNGENFGHEMKKV